MRSTCPVCSREWEVSMFDDYLMPACDCFPNIEGQWPCESCGLSHAWNCEKIGNHAARTAAGPPPVVVELGGPFGPVVKGTIKPEKPSS